MVSCRFAKYEGPANESVHLAAVVFAARNDVRLFVDRGMVSLDYFRLEGAWQPPALMRRP
jgi:hypothetical protein